MLGSKIRHARTADFTTNLIYVNLGGIIPQGPAPVITSLLYPRKFSTKFFVRTIQISNIIKDNFNVINLCQRYPSFDLSEFDIPRGVSADNRLLRDNTVHMVATPRDNTFPVTVMSSLGNHTLHQIKGYSPWIINLNERLSEPIVSITFSDRNLEFAALLDSRASVNCIGYWHFKMVKPNDAPDPPNVRCLGPDGNPIECVGKAHLTFGLGTHRYREEFFVLSQRNELVCIL